MPDSKDLANGFIRLDPNSDVGDSYAHSPQGADSRGPMMNWRTKDSKPQETDIGEKTEHPDTGSYEGHTNPRETIRHPFGKSGANEPPKHGRQGGKEVEKVTDLGSGAGASSSVGGGENY